MTERQYNSIKRKYNALAKRYEGVDLHIARFGIIGEIEGDKVIIDESAALPAMIDGIIEKISEVATHIHDRGYIIDYFYVTIKDSHLIVRAKLQKEWIERFNLNEIDNI